MTDGSEDNIRAEVREKLKKPYLFYKEKLLNYRGEAKKSRRLYTEIIADELVENYSKLSQPWIGINIRTTKPFNVGHNGYSNVQSLEYRERLLAIALFNSEQTYPLGKIKDYEVPLKENRKEERLDLDEDQPRLGKIDLISIDDVNQSVKLIELKIKNNDKGKNGKGIDETLLRALLEIYTYYRLITNSKESKNKFIEESKNKFIENFEPTPEYRIQPAILTDKESLSGEMLLNMNEHPDLQRLISMMNNEIGEQIEGYVYDYPDRDEPFKSIIQDLNPANQKILLRGDITIEKII